MTIIPGTGISGAVHLLAARPWLLVAVMLVALAVPATDVFPAQTIPLRGFALPKPPVSALLKTKNRTQKTGSYRKRGYGNRNRND